jgi:hypothetical protein
MITKRLSTKEFDSVAEGLFDWYHICDTSQVNYILILRNGKFDWAGQRDYGFSSPSPYPIIKDKDVLVALERKTKA